MNTRHSTLIRPPSSLLVAAAVALSLISSLAGCGQESAAQRTPARYPGKPDAAPWDTTRWHDNREEWERAITARAQNQNEYPRIEQ
jgi:predicted small lipoprotein YifL